MSDGPRSCSKRRRRDMTTRTLTARSVACARPTPLLADSSTSYPIATYVRLPLYLQKARRLKEAEREFEALLTGTDARIARDAKHLTMAKRKGVRSDGKRGHLQGDVQHLQA